MRRIALLLLLLPVSAMGQNLVPNPSFEDTLQHTNCITGIEFANHWFNPNGATPDLYSYKSTCGNSSLNNPSGYQLPRTGLCYAGIYGYLQPTREYIAIRLDSNLTSGCTYYIEFYISLANFYGLACDKMGVSFTDDTTGYSQITTTLPLTPVVQSLPGLLLSDTLNWTKVSGNYTANGTETFFLIGNFYDDTNTYWDTINPNGDLSSAYYYIDDVKILPCGMTSLKYIEDASIYIEYFNNSVIITRNSPDSDMELIQSDLLGRELLKQKLQCKNCKEIKVKINESFKGINFLTLKTSKALITKKIIR